MAPNTPPTRKMTYFLNDPLSNPLKFSSIHDIIVELANYFPVSADDRAQKN